MKQLNEHRLNVFDSFRLDNRTQSNSYLKTRYCPLSIASCDLLAAIFVMLKILRLLFVGRIELFNNNGRLAPAKTKTTTRGTQSLMANTGPLKTERFFYPSFIKGY